MAVSTKLGTLTPLIYFVNHRDPAHPPGYILLAPYTDAPTPDGYSREGADTLAAVDRIQTILQNQEFEAARREADYNDLLTRDRFAEVRDRLVARMVSSSTSPYEREFIAAYLRLREEKREKHRRVFETRVAYLNALAYDTPKGRGMDEERVSLDRVNF